MLEQPIRIKSVNVHRNSILTHSILQNDDTSFDIILLQEPWFGSVATLRSDTDPSRNPQSGFTANNKWTTLAPVYSTEEHPKVCIYLNRQTIDHTQIVNHIPPSTLLTPNSMVIDILSPANHRRIELRIVNVYHDKPPSGHALAHIFSHTLDDTIPTLFLGDFNSHSPRWSLPHSTASPWASAFHEWMDSNGLETLNPINEHTWRQVGKRPSIIDLALANESARYFGNLSALTVSWEGSVSDHAALLINFYPETRAPPPHQEARGFYIDPTKKEDWSAAFRSIVNNHDIIHTSDPAHAARLYHEAILAANNAHLDKIKSGPPRGVVWWNHECTTKLHSFRSSPVGEERRKASKSFKSAIMEAKRTWAHEQLFETAKTDNIWNLAQVRKGRRSQVLPPLKDADGTSHSDTNTKATLLKNRFFPTKSNTVDVTLAAQHDPPPPHPTLVTNIRRGNQGLAQGHK